MSSYGTKPAYGGGTNRLQDDKPSLSDSDFQKIDLDKPNIELFDKTADSFARVISEQGRDINLSTQLRRFYDEVCQWEQRIQTNPEKFDEYLPLIRMINAKVSYAEGRKLVDKNFTKLIQDCLRKVTSVKSFLNFKLFFEAFLGFYKMHKPK